jgi:predicted naringenin-chalcone synthase
LNVTVLGFEQNLEFGMLGCAQTMPDLATLRDYLKEQATTLIATFNE